ncbi:unnamed protein product [Acanthoscelides obtectus]|uniref:Transmembrane protein 256 homolog n=1 Tax=Acanthoscelides obtectus TaxID=200917 RepID=A0A9P0JFX2_ACAOB|nr:unnamed protein product [Acanthoscelides obtectus]CAK1661502.1 Transmembrane protein 256 [Acanthoscelides obtectus]
MGFNNIINYVIFDNPISKSATNLLSRNISGSKAVPSVTVITEKVPLWKLAAESGPFLKIAGVMGATAVALGAYGAHRSYPKDKAQELKPVFETANRMHFFHALALIGVNLCRYPRVAGTLIVTGTLLFSGPCYYYAFTGEHKFGKLAPIGGTILIIGWLSMVV